MEYRPKRHRLPLLSLPPFNEPYKPAIPSNKNTMLPIYKKTRDVLTAPCDVLSMISPFYTLAYMVTVFIKYKYPLTTRMKSLLKGLTRLWWWLSSNLTVGNTFYSMLFNCCNFYCIILLLNLYMIDILHILSASFIINNHLLLPLIIIYSLVLL